MSQADAGAFLLMSLLVYVIISVSLIPWVAGEKGRSRFGWLLISLCMSPLLALIALAAVPDKLGPRLVALEPAAGEEIPEFKWRRGG